MWEVIFAFIVVLVIIVVYLLCSSKKEGVTSYYYRKESTSGFFDITNNHFNPLLITDDEKNDKGYNTGVSSIEIKVLGLNNLAASSNPENYNKEVAGIENILTKLKNIPLSNIPLDVTDLRWIKSILAATPTIILPAYIDFLLFGGKITTVGKFKEFLPVYLRPAFKYFNTATFKSKNGITTDVHIADLYYPKMADRLLNEYIKVKNGAPPISLKAEVNASGMITIKKSGVVIDSFRG